MDKMRICVSVRNNEHYAAYASPFFYHSQSGDLQVILWSVHITLAPSTHAISARISAISTSHNNFLSIKSFWLWKENWNHKVRVIEHIQIKASKHLLVLSIHHPSPGTIELFFSMRTRIGKKNNFIKTPCLWGSLSKMPKFFHTTLFSKNTWEECMPGWWLVIQW